MSTHTPGPWKVSLLDPFVIGPVRILAVPEMEAYVPQLQAVARVVDRTGESDANARLIAAAPELLDLLQRAVRYCPVEVQDQMYAAIAKVEGP